MAFYAVSASAQTPGPPHGQKHVGPVHAAPQVDVAARLALLDERIALLTADMRMFAGELKIQAMADLIEAVIERQQLTDNEMNRMRERMRDRMNDRSRPVPPPSGLEPETLCSPFI
jgi:hypothetical protein